MVWTWSQTFTIAIWKVDLMDLTTLELVSWELTLWKDTSHYSPSKVIVSFIIQEEGCVSSIIYRIMQLYIINTGKWVSSEKMDLFQGRKYQIHPSSTSVQSNDCRGSHAWWDDLGRCKTCLNWVETGLWTAHVTDLLISHGQTPFRMGSG